MSVEIVPTAIPEVRLIRPRRFADARGWFSESFRAEWAEAIGCDRPFVQDNHAYNGPAGVLRGLHFQYPEPQAKLVRVARGRILDVAVDIRRGSPSFGSHAAVELSASEGSQLFVPAGFAHGYITLEPETEVLYKVDAYYNAAGNLGLLWSDPALALPWPAGLQPILSAQDQRWPTLAELQTPF